LPETVKYLGVGRYDGRTSISIEATSGGKTFQTMSIKAGYAEDLSIKKAQYESLYTDEIYNMNNHAECDLANMELWLRYLSEKDPEGKKRKTQSWLMENVITPQNRVVSESEILKPTQDKTRACAPLVGAKVISDIYWYSATQIFNFGRCIMKGNFYASDECGVPTNFTLQQIEKISKYVAERPSCGPVCGDGNCDRGEDWLHNPVQCDVDCIKNKPNSSEEATCSSLGGAICTKYQTCSGKIKIASDTKNCCVEGSCIE
jgi:hypothetical protein